MRYGVEVIKMPYLRQQISAYTRPVSKIEILLDVDDAPEGALCSVQPSGNGGGGLYVDFSIAQLSEESNCWGEKSCISEEGSWSLP